MGEGRGRGEEGRGVGELTNKKLVRSPTVSSSCAWIKYCIIDIKREKDIMGERQNRSHLACFRLFQCPHEKDTKEI